MVAEVAGQSTETATRPLYQPQLPHTTWGSLADWHRGQVLRDGAPRRQLDARRMRVFDFDFFFLGTATVVSLVSLCEQRTPVGAVEG